jgi:hypothetical protein
VAHACFRAAAIWYSSYNSGPSHLSGLKTSSAVRYSPAQGTLPYRRTGASAALVSGRAGEIIASEYSLAADSGIGQSNSHKTNRIRPRILSL